MIAVGVSQYVVTFAGCEPGPRTCLYVTNMRHRAVQYCAERIGRPGPRISVLTPKLIAIADLWITEIEL